MNISELSLRRPVFAIVCSIVIVLFGLVAMKFLGVREFPATDPPIITVRTNYTGANANVIENPAEVAQRLETLIQSIQTERDLIRKVSIPTIEGVILLPLSDIMYIEAMRSYAQFHLSNGKKIIASRPIGDFEDVLPDPTFFRIHKSHTINLNYVERYIRGEGGSVILQNGSEIGVSRTAKAELLRRLQIS